MRLFDDINRTNQRSKRENEPLFEYYNFSARKPVAALRDLLEGWFHRYPEAAKPDLRARFRSRIDAQHQGSFFELYLHELLCSMAFEVSLHPNISKNTPTHPDFVVSRAGQQCFYLEATLALPSQDQVAKQRMIAQVYDTLNEMPSPNFFVSIQVQGYPTTPPSGKRLRKELQRWLAALDPDELSLKLEEEGVDSLPSFEWEHEGWNVSFLPIPKSPGLRSKPGVRPIGITIPEGGWIDSHSPIRRAISTKATKYGDLNLSYIIAVNVIDIFAGKIDIMNALFGQEGVTVYQKANGEFVEKPSRQPNGAWVAPRGPQNTRVSAALIMANLSPWSTASQTPILVHHPWASKPIAPEVWPLTQQVPNMETLRMEEQSGKSANTFLCIPPPWPIPDDSLS